MEIAFEFVRTTVNALSRKVANVVLEASLSRPTVRSRIIAAGQWNHRTYVYVRYFMNQRVHENGQAARVTVSVKPLPEDRALEVGSDTVADFIVFVVTLTLVSFGLRLRWLKSANAAAREEATRERVEVMEEQLKEIREMLNELLEKKSADALIKQ